jgi:hypothetical protein
MKPVSPVNNSFPSGRGAHLGALLFDFVEKEEGEAWSALSLRVLVCGFRAADRGRRDDAELRFF